MTTAPLLPPGSGSSPHLLPRNWTGSFLGGPEAPWSLLTWEFRWPGGKKPKGQDYLVPGPTWTYRADPAGICFLRPGLRMDLAQKGTEKKPGGRPSTSPTSTTTSGLVSKLTSLPSQQVGLGQRLQQSLPLVRVTHLYHLPHKGPFPGSWMAGGPVTSAPRHARPLFARPTLSCGAGAPTPTPAYIHTLVSGPQNTSTRANTNARTTTAYTRRIAGLEVGDRKATPGSRSGVRPRALFPTPS